MLALVRRHHLRPRIIIRHCCCYIRLNNRHLHPPLGPPRHVPPDRHLRPARELFGQLDEVRGLPTRRQDVLVVAAEGEGRRPHVLERREEARAREGIPERARVLGVDLRDDGRLCVFP